MKTSFVLFVASFAQCATITTGTTATVAGCNISDARFSQCTNADSTATASANAGYNPAIGNYGAVMINVVADGTMATASATATVDGWFTVGYTGMLTGVYLYDLGPPLVGPPLSILQGNANFHTSVATQGQVMHVVSQVTQGVPFEVQISLSETVNWPSGDGNGEAELIGFLDPSGNPVVVADATPVPEPATWLLVPLSLGLFSLLKRRSQKRFS